MSQAQLTWQNLIANSASCSPCLRNVVQICQAVVLCKGGRLHVHTFLLQLSAQQGVAGLPVLARPDPLRGADLLAVLSTSTAMSWATTMGGAELLAA